MPLVSVVLPVKNGQDYLKGTIQSLQSQTFQDFEIILIDDQSTDRSVQIAVETETKKLKVLTTNHEGGLVNALNLGIQNSSGKFIARLDSDDLAVPTRFEKQVKLLHNEPKVIVCGSWAQTFGKSNRLLKYPQSSDAIRAQMLFSNPFAHPSVMMRRSAFANISYNKNYPVAEDYQLWTELSKIGELVNIPEKLIKYRVHSGQVSERKAEIRRASVSRIYENLFNESGLDFSPDELALHFEIANNAFFLVRNPPRKAWSTDGFQNYPGLISMR